MHNKHNQKKYFIINPTILYLNINHITFLTYLPLLKKNKPLPVLLQLFNKSELFFNPPSTKTIDCKSYKIINKQYLCSFFYHSCSTFE